MNLSRRSFFLGVAKVGALAILPVPLLISPKEEILIEPIKSWFETDLSLINLGNITRTFTSIKKSGIYFNEKFLPVQGISLNAYRDQVDITSLIAPVRKFIAGDFHIELDLEGVSIQENLQDLLENQEEINVDIVQGNARYRGDFTIHGYTLRSPI